MGAEEHAMERALWACKYLQLAAGASKCKSLPLSVEAGFCIRAGLAKQMCKYLWASTRRSEKLYLA